MTRWLVFLIWPELAIALLRCRVLMRWSGWKARRSQRRLERVDHKIAHATALLKAAGWTDAELAELERQALAEDV